MPLEVVGYRRLYDAIGCSIVGQQELRISFPMGKIHAEVYLGSRPKFGIACNLAAEEKYIVPSELSMMANIEYKKDATQSSYPRHFFTEIFCYKEVDVPQELSDAFHARDSHARDVLLQLASQERDLFNQTVDVIAGTIGLRFHRQFILELINENYVAIQNENEDVLNFFGPGMEILEEVPLNLSGVSALNHILPALGQAQEASLKYGAKALGWLMRGWSERDAVTKFMNLFIALEVILNGVSGIENQEITLNNAIQLQALIDEYGGDKKSELTTFFKTLMEKQRPSMNDRFKILACQAGFEGWESDVLAFKRFNHVRNGLIHHGEQKIQMIVSVEDDEVRQIEDLAERYVSKVLFGDGVVYQSQWRNHSKSLYGDVHD